MYQCLNFPFWGGIILFIYFMGGGANNINSHQKRPGNRIRHSSTKFTTKTEIHVILDLERWIYPLKRDQGVAWLDQLTCFLHSTSGLFLLVCLVFFFVTCVLICGFPSNVQFKGK